MTHNHEAESKKPNLAKEILSPVLFFVNVSVERMTYLNEYMIKLDGEVIGITKLESADAPMGVVSGIIVFTKSLSGFELFKDFCQINKCKINIIDEEHKFIDTQVIEKLTVFRQDGFEIKGVGNCISGMDSEGFEISVLGISYPFYEQEFPHHVKEYLGR